MDMKRTRNGAGNIGLQLTIGHSLTGKKLSPSIGELYNYG